MVHPLFDGPEIDGFLHDLKVVGDSQAIRINRVMEDVCGAAPPEAIDEALGRFVPAIVERSVGVRKGRSRDLLKQRVVLKDLSHNRTKLLKLFIFLIRHLLV